MTKKSNSNRKYIFLEEAKKIREVREQKGITQHEFAEKVHVTQPLISKIEKGCLYVDLPLYQAICQELGLETLEESISPTLSQVEPNWRTELELLELRIQVDVPSALERLRIIESDYHFNHGANPLFDALCSFLRAKATEKQKKWEEAYSYFEKVISYRDQIEDHHNLIAESYNGMSRACYRLHEWKRSLLMIDKGLKFVSRHGNRAYIYSTLLTTKAGILEKLGRDTEALRIIEQFWEEPPDVKISEVWLNMYQIRLEILNKLKRYEETIPLGSEALQIARIENNYDRILELLSVIGEAYFCTHDLLVAQRIYEESIAYEEKARRKYLITTTRTNLARLLLRSGQVEQAFSHVKYAIEMGNEHPDHHRLCVAYQVYGECCFFLKLYEESVSAWEKALILAEEKNLDWMKVDILLLFQEFQKHTNQRVTPVKWNLYQTILNARRKGGFDSMLFHHDPPET